MVTQRVYQSFVLKETFASGNAAHAGAGLPHPRGGGAPAAKIVYIADVVAKKKIGGLISPIATRLTKPCLNRWPHPPHRHNALPQDELEDLIRSVFEKVKNYIQISWKVKRC